MSNGRRSNVGNRYRTGYLKSGVWFARRDRWFAEEEARRGQVRCAITGQPGTKHTLQLHHLDYAGVRWSGTTWIAGESHDDLVAVRADVHEQLHRMLDTDQALRRNRRRRDANLHAINRLRRRLHATLTDWTTTMTGASA